MKITEIKTIDRYHELVNKQNTVDVKKFQCFFAFSQDQFETGFNSLHLPEGSKVCSFGAGMYGTREGLEKYKAFLHSIDERIKAECNPQEVYAFECRNHECGTNWEGDLEPIKIIASIWGWGLARTIKRRNEYYTIDQIIDHLKTGKFLP